VNDRFGAIVPAYNEESRVVSVLRDLKKQLHAGNIVVIDDGSTDRTAETARAEGVHVVRHEHNKGKGDALKAGFAHFYDRPHVEAVFTLDADGQHDPVEIPAFIERYEQTGADVIIGSRMADTSAMPPLRIMTNRFTSAVITMRSGCRIADSQSGYRLIKVALLRRLKLVTSRFDTESEILIRAARSGAVIDEVPIQTIYAGEKSKINPLRDTLRFFRLVVRSFFW
jgi:glycosyltransferase involved in cell wall biosynthesis